MTLAQKTKPPFFIPATFFLLNRESSMRSKQRNIVSFLFFYGMRTIPNSPEDKAEKKGKWCRLGGDVTGQVFYALQDILSQFTGFVLNYETE